MVKRKENPPLTAKDYATLVNRLADNPKYAGKFWAKRGLTIEQANELAEAEKAIKETRKVRAIRLKPILYRALQGLAKDEGKSLIVFTEEIMTEYLMNRPGWLNKL